MFSIVLEWGGGGISDKKKHCDVIVNSSLSQGSFSSLPNASKEHEAKMEKLHKRLASLQNMLGEDSPTTSPR